MSFPPTVKPCLQGQFFIGSKPALLFPNIKERNVSKSNSTYYLQLTDTVTGTPVSLKAIELFSGFLGFFTGLFGICNWWIRRSHKDDYVETRVKLDGDKGTTPVLLKISSLEKRLLLTKQEIREAANARALAKLINTRVQIFNKYNDLLGKYEESAGEELFSSKLGQAQPLRSLTLPKLLKLIEKVEEVRQKEGALNSGLLLTVDGEQFIAKVENDKLCLLHWSQKESANQEKPGTVFKVLDVANGVFKAVKVANSQNAQKDLRKEFQLLKRLSAPQSVPTYISWTNLLGNSEGIVMPYASLSKKMVKVRR